MLPKMKALEISEKVIELIKAKYPEGSCTDMVQYMIDSGLIEEKRALRWVIKWDYYQRLKGKRYKSFNDIKLDLAVDYDVSKRFVDKIIYYYTEIKPD